MHKLFDQVLVSCPNGGGLFLLQDGRVRRLDYRQCTGLDVRGDLVLRGLQPRALSLTGSKGFDVEGDNLPLDDVHDVLVEEDSCYAVGTSGNEVVRLNYDGREIQRWVFAHAKDSWHINCLTRWNCSLVFSAFGHFSDTRGYKGATDGAGFVQELISGRIIIDGLSQPHSLVPDGEQLLLANSERKEIRQYGPDGVLIRSVALDGYTRGICISKSVIYVGLSCSRNIEDVGLATAMIVALDRVTWNELGRIAVPAQEIYAIKEVADHSNLMRALGGVGEDVVTHLHTMLEARERTAASLGQRVADYEVELAEKDAAWKARLDQLDLAQSVELENRRCEIELLKQVVFDYSAELQSRRREIERLNTAVLESDGRALKVNNTLLEREAEISKLKEVLRGGDVKLSEILNSRSWLLTKPLRFSARILRGEFEAAFAPVRRPYVSGFVSRLRQAKNGARYLLRGDIKGLRDRIRARRRDAVMYALTGPGSAANVSRSWAVMTPPHTLYIAYLIADRLRSHGWAVDVMTEAPDTFPHDYYIVLCPQTFSRLPPGEKRIVYQLEQSVSSRWFTQDYLNTLENSLAVLEYALVNVEFLQQRHIAYPHVHYLPIGASLGYGESISEENVTCDVLFYGDCNSSPRRRRMLEALRAHFDVRVVSEVFGNEMLRLVKQARVVLNLHYYENALLEMPRIQECLSLGVPIVSERARDIDDYPEIQGAVRFFEEDSIPAMLSAVRLALDSPVSKELVQKAVDESARRFTFMFDRFLIAMGLLPCTHVREMQPPLSKTAAMIALSLPETINRRRIFEEGRPEGVAIFDGIRRSPGWVGCALSYVALAQNALNNGLSTITIMEDDVILPGDFDHKFSVVREYLDARSGTWDVFAGLIASLHPDCRVLDVEVFKGMTFVIVNKMTSMVFNIYSEGFMRLLLSWDPTNLDTESNTIDRYIESRSNLRVVVPLPFLVGHREEVYSTLWGFQNTQYRDLIAASEASLYEKVRCFQESLQHNSGSLII